MSKFFLYARKSTDEADRQVLSIEAQITELKEFAERERLEIVQTFIESQTAKEPGRPIFNEMLSLVEKGKAEGILSWHPDRLARNSVDGGRIIYLVDTAKLCQLKFPTFWFENTPQGKFMLSIAFGQSKYYIDNLSENVKRGLRQKVRKGEFPGPAPIGYLNDLVTHKIVKDNTKIRLVAKMFKLYSTGSYSLKGLREEIFALGLVGKSGKKISNSNVQHILSSPFYYGAFKFNGELFQGRHEPAVSKKLFDRCQEILSDKSRPKSKHKKEYAFRGLFKCGECGCSITAETQKGHNYYRCTKKKAQCTQRYIREELLAESISIELQKVSLNEATKNRMLEELLKEQQTQEVASGPFAQKLREQIAECEQKLDLLLDERLNKTITTEEYTSKKQKILNQKIENEEKLSVFERKGNRWLEPLQNFINTAHQAQTAGLQGNFSEKKNFLKRIGSNPLLQNRQIVLMAKKPWELCLNKSKAQP
ncbi:MAG: recombinase family protein [Candidatus Doudnabacteria bacterium]|nr:recombinase family protein [Candidatus Doudnabacteria bacterium]